MGLKGKAWDIFYFLKTCYILNITFVSRAYALDKEIFTEKKHEKSIKNFRVRRK
jgi:hypothetical protein